MTVLNSKLLLQVNYQWLRVVTSDFKHRQVSKQTKKSMECLKEPLERKCFQGARSYIAMKLCWFLVNILAQVVGLFLSMKLCWNGNKDFFFFYVCSVTSLSGFYIGTKPKAKRRQHCIIKQIHIDCESHRNKYKTCAAQEHTGTHFLC